VRALNPSLESIHDFLKVNGTIHTPGVLSMAHASGQAAVAVCPCRVCTEKSESGKEANARQIACTAE